MEDITRLSSELLPTVNPPRHASPNMTGAGIRTGKTIYDLFDWNVHSFVVSKFVMPAIALKVLKIFRCVVVRSPIKLHVATDSGERR